ncbi:GGDEF domain-containing protein [Streptomyces sp. NPDC087908]|uniref:GGDEF domain-containing protein n=1 Tax=Streptomyces sp. NPDC087908 TaxID=3365820 RepID=UPI0037FF1D5B
MDSVLHTSGPFGPRTLLITTAAVPLTGWAIHAVALHKQLAATRKDPLTGLMRRDAYTHRARRLLARHEEVAVVMVDADRFKQINDRLGHAAGDTVLAAFGTRLMAWAGPRAAVGRLGGDEFAIALELPAARRALRLEQLVRMLHTPATLDDGRTVDVAASVGVATPDMIGCRELSALQRAADAALYDGKHSGHAVLATPAHAAVPSVNGRRAGRPGTAPRGGERHEHHVPSPDGRLDPRHQR